MRRTALVIAPVVLLAVAGCTPSPTAQLEANKDLIRQFTEVLNAADWDALAAIVADSFVRHSAATAGPPVRSRDDFIQLQDSFLISVPDQRVTIQQLVAEGDRVAGLATYSGTQTGPMGDLPATGNTFEIPFLAIFRIESGRIAELWVEWDNVALLTQLGLFPPPTPGPGSWPPNPATADVHRLREAAPVCRHDTPFLTPDSVGPIRKGMTLSDIQQQCTLQYAWQFLEGMPSPVAVTMLGEMRLIIEFTDTTATSAYYRMWTESTAARTVEGFGPGSTVHEVVEHWPSPRFAAGEGNLFMLFDAHNWISLQIQVPGTWDWNEINELERTNDVNLLPEGTSVVGVLLLNR